MVKEDYVSFELAKLLKFKNFNLSCSFYYDNDGNLQQALVYDFCGNEEFKRPMLINEYTDFNNWFKCRDLYIKDVECSAPTLSLVVKWLMDVHKLLISCNYIDKSEIMFNESQGFSFNIRNMKTLEDMEGYGYSSFERALEAGIIESLNLI